MSYPHTCSHSKRTFTAGLRCYWCWLCSEPLPCSPAPRAQARSCSPVRAESEIPISAPITVGEANCASSSIFREHVAMQGVRVQAPGSCALLVYLFFLFFLFFTREMFYCFILPCGILLTFKHLQHVRWWALLCFVGGRVKREKGTVTLPKNSSVPHRNKFSLMADDFLRIWKLGGRSLSLLFSDLLRNHNIPLSPFSLWKPRVSGFAVHNETNRLQSCVHIPVDHTEDTGGAGGSSWAGGQRAWEEMELHHGKRKQADPLGGARWMKTWLLKMGHSKQVDSRE